MSIFGNILRAFGAHAAPRGPAGHRAYGVGDIHGRLDLLDEVLARIEADIAARPAAINHVIFLGDLIDRGPDSAGVIDRLRGWQPGDVRPVFLCGNHEEVLLRVLDGERALLGDWLKYGGRECLSSYGLPPETLAGLSEAEALDRVRGAIPDEHRRFVAGFADTFAFGDYLFVHAGIRPGVGLAAQGQKDLRWIRQPFLDDARDHGFVVVHGHSISEGVDQRGNRIGIDTGAYRSGILTAIGIEGAGRWFIATGGAG